MAAACQLSPAEMRAGARAFTALHEGLPPKRVRCVAVPRTPGPAAVRAMRRLGVISEVQYFKTTPDGTARYHHPFAPAARPTLHVDRAGRYWIDAGRYEVSYRGIEDRVVAGKRGSPYLKVRHVRAEKLPTGGRKLILLGNVEWLRYIPAASPGARPERLEFHGNGPLLAHDDAGNLRCLKASDVHAKGNENPMKHRRRHARRHHAHANPGEGAVANPRHKHRGRRHHARRNPSHAAKGGKPGFGAETKSLLLLSLELGGVALVSGLVMNKGLDYTQLSPLWKAVSKIGIGVVGGAALAVALPASYAAIPAGVAVGGVLGGLTDLYHLYAEPQINALMNRPAAAALPAGFTGVPAGYTAYSPQACAVGAR